MNLHKRKRWLSRSYSVLWTVRSGMISVPLYCNQAINDTSISQEACTTSVTNRSRIC